VGETDDTHHPFNLPCSRRPPLLPEKEGGRELVLLRGMVEEVTRVGKVPEGAWVGLLPFLGTGVCGCGGWVVWWCAPRPGCGLERERGVVLREQGSESAEGRGLDSLVVDRKRQINNTINGSCSQQAREREGGEV